MKRITTPLLNVFYSFLKDFFHGRIHEAFVVMVSEALVKSKTRVFQATSLESVIGTSNHHQVAEMENSEGVLLPWDLSHTLKVALRQFIL